MELKRNKTKSVKFRTSRPHFLAVDFFCGAGGTTRGLIDAGGYVIAGIDKDDRCRETYVQNNINCSLDSRPAQFLTYDIFRRTRNYPSGQQTELLTALGNLIPRYRRSAPTVPLLFSICAPCQPFTRLSRADMSVKRKALRRRDKNLLREATVFVKRFGPELILSENVQGIRDPKYGKVWDAFRKRLEALGYATGTKVVCTSRFGIAQYRKRSILLAVRRKLVQPERLTSILKGALMVPESDPESAMVSVQQAIGHLPVLRPGERHSTIPNHYARALSKLNHRRLAAAKPGESNAYLEKTRSGDLSLTCHRKVTAKLGARCFGDVYTRMHPARPSPTITTRCNSVSNGRFGHYDVKQVRAISPREAAILQSFPETYVFYPLDEMDSVARMIGNAVPPKLAAFFSSYLASSVRVKGVRRASRR